MPSPKSESVDGGLTKIDVLLCIVPIGLFLSILAVA
jgi:hypothetical protein